MTTTTTSPSAVSRAAGCLWRLIKLFVAIVLGILLGVLLYYGGLYAYWGILAPINSNTHAINTLDAELRRARDRFDAELRIRDERIRLLSEQLDQRRQRTDVLEERLSTQLRAQEEALRGQMAAGQEALQKQLASLDEGRGVLAETLGQQDRRIARLEEAARTQQEALNAQREEMARLAAEQAALETAIGDTASKLSGDLAALQKELEADIAGLEAGLETLQGQIAGPEAELAGLRERTLLLKAATQVLHIRMRLMQNNPGGAREGLALLDGTLAEIGDLLGAEASVISGLREQVAQVRTALDENPFIVVEQLDVLWLAITDLITF